MSYNQNQNRFKFTVKQNNFSNNQINRSQFQNSEQFNANNHSINYYNNQNNLNNKSNQSNQNAQFKQNSKINEEILIDDKDDEDLLDISDTELIRASQVVESQLKFTNNVHHTTSNALNIFSQFNSNNYNNNDCNLNIMGPPVSTTIYSNSNLNNDPYNQLDDIKSELKQLRSENMQKDGEVKILRDKLKRLEQDTQRMRAEKVDLVKKLQQQQEEAKKHLQKQIEFKELENQFKSQEIVELTMKYKVLESTVRKNPNSTVLLSSTPTVSLLNQSQSVFDDNSALINLKKSTQMLPPKNCPPQQIQQPKTLPTKRSAQSYNSSLNSSSLSDTENDNPILDMKRPLLSLNTSNNKPISTSNQMRHPLSPYSTNSSSILPPQATNLKQDGKLFQNSSLQTPPTGLQNIAKTLLKSEPFMSNNVKQTTKIQNFKRNCVLNTKIKSLPNQNKQELADMSLNEKLYLLTDKFAETANYLCKFNSMLKQVELNETNLNYSNKISHLNVFNLNKKLIELNDFIRDNLRITKKNLFNSSIGTERIEFVSNRLNDELLKLIEYCLKTSTTSPNEIYSPYLEAISNPVLSFTSLENNLNTLNNSKKTIINSTKPANFKSFIDLLCLSFNICFNLFLFRVNYLLSNPDCSLSHKKFLKSTTYDKLLKLKEKFFLLISQLLESINFSTSSSSQRSKLCKSFPKIDTTKSTFSSYSTLKIFNSILDCLNHLLYLPSSIHFNEPYSIYTCFYSGLVENIHTIFKNIKVINLKKDDSDDKSDEDDNQIHDDEEDDHCLFQLFYDKLLKYFGDIVYALEPNECSKSNEEVNQTDNSDQQMQIITTIAADDIKSSKVDFKLDSRSNNHLNSANSETDLQNEIFASQADVSNATNKNVNPINNSHFQNSSNSTYSDSKPALNSNNCLDYLNINSIHNLKIEFLRKFIYFLHNFQFNQSLDIKLKNRSLLLLNSNNNKQDVNMENNNCNKKRRIYESMTNLKSCANDQNKSAGFILTNNQKCSCFKDMLNTFLILIDYQFNEKFMFNGSKINFYEYFLASSSTQSVFLLYNQIQDNLIDYTNETNEQLDSNNSHEKYRNIDQIRNTNITISSLMEQEMKLSQKEKVTLINESENTSQFMNLLILLSFNAFVSLFNNDKYSKTYEKTNEISSESIKQRLDYLNGIRNDYRLKNFFCLYKLAESNYDESFLNKANQHQEETMETNSNQECRENCSSRVYDHLKCSLNSLKSLFKIYIDEYFDFS